MASQELLLSGAEAVRWAAAALAAQVDPGFRSAPWPTELDAMADKLVRIAGLPEAGRAAPLKALAANGRLMRHLRSLTAAAETPPAASATAEAVARRHRASQLRPLLDLLQGDRSR